MATQQRVLVATVEHQLRESISQTLHKHDLSAIPASDGIEALALWEQHAPALLVLHAQLPRLSGVELCQRIRRRADVPILLLIPAEQASSTVLGLSAGADDCLTVPFTEHELLARLRTIQYRTRRPALLPEPEVLEIGRLRIDLAGYQLQRDGQPVHLTRTEWAILQELIRSAGQVLSHRVLLQRVWGEAYGAERDYVHGYIRRLRRKLEENPAAPQYLLTEPGLGYRLQLPSQPASPSATAAARPSSLRLPAPTTSFIGREAERTILQSVLRRGDVRLMSLIGPPGIGKTRLALHVASAELDAFADGVAFVALAAIRDPAAMISAIAQTFALTEADEQPLVGRLKSYLQSRQVLLVLDNFEQVTAAAPLVAELVSAAPQLTVLVTSRVRLHVYGEYEFVVPPLALPDLRQPLAAATLAQCAAVALFITRAQSVTHSFALTDENAAAVAELCTRLEGLPLAIELAAAQIRLYAPATMLLHMRRRLALLNDGPAMLPTHHQTLRGAIGWSYELLSAEQQVLFARLGVFAGGCSAEAATAVCNAARDLPPALGDSLLALVDQSMLQRSTTRGGAARWSMLETIKEYALERLVEQGALETLRRAHALYYVDLAEIGEVELRGAQQESWLQRLEDEHANLQAALAWAIERPEPEVALRLSGALWRFWYLHGYFSEGRHWLDRALAASGVQQSAMRAKTLHGTGVLAWAQGHYQQALTLLEQCLTLRRELGDKPGISQVLSNLGMITYHQSDYARAQTFYEESLALFAELGDNRGVANTLNNLGIVLMYQGDYTQARLMYEDSLARYREAGDPSGITAVLTNLGVTALYQEDYARASLLLEEGLALFRARGDRRNAATVLTNLGRAATEQGDTAGATALLHEALAIRQELEDREGMTWILEGLAHVALAQGTAARAAQLGGAAEALREALGAPMPPADRRQYDRVVAALAAALGPAAFAELWAAGRALPLEQALALARSPSAASAVDPAAPAEPLGPAPAHPLTAREVAIGRLVACGLTDREIADQLAISPRTVDSHLRRIFGKVHVSSRSALAAWIVRAGLSESHEQITSIQG